MFQSTERREEYATSVASQDHVCPNGRLSANARAFGRQTGDAPQWQEEAATYRGWQGAGCAACVEMGAQMGVVQSLAPEKYSSGPLVFGFYEPISLVAAAGFEPATKGL